MGLQIQILNAGTGREIQAAFAAISRERSDALFVSPALFRGPAGAIGCRLITRATLPKRAD